MFRSTSSKLWLGRAKEKEIIEMYEKHLDQILETVERMDETVRAFCEESDEEVEELARKAFESERKADEIKDKILEKLFSGLLSPTNRETIIRLILASDDIADNAKSGAVKLTFLDCNSFSDEVLESIKKLSKFSLETVKVLREVVLTVLEKPKTVKEEAEKVEDMEENVDKFRGEILIPQIIRWADSSELPGTAYMISKVEDNIEEVVDMCEETVDVVREIAIVSL